MRKTLIPLVLVAACTSPNSPTAPTVNTSRPSLALDIAQAPAPTNVSAVVVQVLDSKTVVVRLTWTDNSTFLDEFNTCASAADKDGVPSGGGCVYASAYDLPAGSTGVRSGTITVGSNTATVSLRTNRSFQTADGWNNVAGSSSAPVAVSPITVATIKGKKK